MKFRILLLLGVAIALVAICHGRPTEEEYPEYDEEPPAPPPSKPTRPNPLKGRRNPLTNRAKASSTTQATVAEAEEEEEDIGEEPAQEGSSTTEAPKKIKAGSVRPFRSNDDLLAALKRRREQASHQKAQVKTVHHEDEHANTEAPAPKSRPSSGARKRYNTNNHSKQKDENQKEEPASSTQAPARTGRRFSSRIP